MDQVIFFSVFRRFYLAPLEYFVPFVSSASGERDFQILHFKSSFDNLDLFRQ